MPGTETQNETERLSPLRARVRALVEKKWFQRFIIALIVINAVILGIETYPAVMAEYGDTLHLINGIIIGLFVAEIVLRIYAYGWPFFKDGWNLFDFFVVVAALVPAGTQSGALRLLRLLRVFRLLSAVRSMRLVVNALMASIPGILSMGGLFLMVLYVFAIASTTILGPMDPTNYGDLGTTFTSLYRIVMGDGWETVVAPLASQEPWVWVYFVIFSFIGAVIMLNLFVAVVVEAMNRIQTDELEESQAEETEITNQVLVELRQLRSEVADLKPPVGD